MQSDKTQTGSGFSLVSLPLACGMSFYRISVGSLKENILGTCLACGSSYDDYSSRCRCSHCRMLVLVCPMCQVESNAISFNALLMQHFNLMLFCVSALKCKLLFLISRIPLRNMYVSYAKRMEKNPAKYQQGETAKYKWGYLNLPTLRRHP